MSNTSNQVTNNALAVLRALDGERWGWLPLEVQIAVTALNPEYAGAQHHSKPTPTPVSSRVNDALSRGRRDGIESRVVEGRRFYRYVGLDLLPPATDSIEKVRKALGAPSPMSEDDKALADWGVRRGAA